MSKKTSTLSQDRLLLSFANLLAISGVLSYAILASENGYWRHDSWVYRGLGFFQFRHGGRWLNPILQPYLRHWPPFLAWLIGVFCLWFFGYRLAKRLLPATEINSAWLSTATGSVLIFIPGLLGNLEWPVNIMAVTIVLALAAHYVETRRGLFIASASTIAIAGLLQDFLPFTLLLFLPSFHIANKQSHRQLHVLMLRRLCIWCVVVLFSLLFSKLLQLAWFGHIPALANWRNPQPANNITQFILNLGKNANVALHQLKQTFSWLGLIAILIAVTVVVLRAIRNCRNSSTIIASYYLLSSAGVLAFVYVATAPYGVGLPFRITLTFGPFILLLIMALYISTRSIRVVIYLAIAMMIVPFSVGFANMHWFEQFTSSFKQSIVNVNRYDPKFLSGVVVQTKNTYKLAKGSNADPLFLDRNIPKVFEPLYNWLRLKRAFKSIGFKRIIQCQRSNKSSKSICNVFNKYHFQWHCSNLFNWVCAASSVKKNFLIMKFAS